MSCVNVSTLLERLASAKGVLISEIEAYEPTTKYPGAGAVACGLYCAGATGGTGGVRYPRLNSLDWCQEVMIHTHCRCTFCQLGQHQLWNLSAAEESEDFSG